MKKQFTMNISIVVPLFNEDESLPDLISWIDKVMLTNKFSYEVLFIDDGSTDKSWQVIQELKVKFPCIRAYKFRRNYGKSAALYIGFEEAKGEVVITMDADLQDSPEEIPFLYKMIIEDGYDLVSGWKQKRYDPISKTIPSKLFNYIARVMSGIQLNDFNCGLKAYRLNVVKNIELYGEMHRYIPILAKQEGFSKIGERVVAHQERQFGVTKFGLNRFINGFLDLLSITFITKFGKKPMHFFGLLGTLMLLIGFVSSAFMGIQKLYSLSLGIKSPLLTDSPYFYIALTTMIIGSQLFLTGFIGELISRNSSERNHYNIEDKI